MKDPVYGIIRHQDWTKTCAAVLCLTQDSAIAKIPIQSNLDKI